MGRKANRRKRQIINIMVLLVPLLAAIIITFHLKATRAELKEAQKTLEKLEEMLSGISPGEWSEEMQSEGMSSDRAEVVFSDYVESIGNIMVEKPVRRTYGQVISRLKELGKDNSVIAEIYKNHTKYPDSLLEALANNPEMADFAAGYLGDRAVAGGLTDREKEQEFPLFLQWDPRWGYEQYGEKEDCIAVAGCGPTCMSMVLFSLTRDETLTPDKLAAFAMRNNYYLEGSGTIWAFMQDVPAKYDIGVIEVDLSEQEMKAVLDDGGMLICSMMPGDFTAAGHFIVIYGYDRNGFKVNDPNCVARSRKSWSYEEIKGQIKMLWGYTKGAGESGNRNYEMPDILYQSDYNRINN